MSLVFLVPRPEFNIIVVLQVSHTVSSILYKFYEVKLFVCLLFLSSGVCDAAKANQGQTKDDT